MLALLLATASVYLWSRTKRGLLPGAVLLALSMGIYQAYFSVAVTLILLLSLNRLWNNEERVLQSGLSGIAFLVLGGVLYMLLNRISLSFMSIHPQPVPNSFLNLFKNFSPALLADTYLFWGKKMIRQIPAYSLVTECLLNGILLLSGVWKWMAYKKQKTRKKTNYILLVLLLGLLPLGINCIFIMTGGFAHDLMCYSFPLIYLLFLLDPAGNSQKQQPIKTFRKRCGQMIASIVIVCMLWGNIVSANVLYTKKDLEQRATYAKMIQISNRLQTEPGYVPGETEVAFIGGVSLTPLPIKSDYYAVTGASAEPIWTGAPKRIFNLYQAYFRFILQTPLKSCSYEEFEALKKDPRVRKMEFFPAESSLQWIDGIVVFKISEE